MVLEEHVIELLPAYALDCLDESELAQVSEHLKICSQCRSELRAFQAVADQLPLAVPQVDPPARLKPAIMERVQVERSQERPTRLQPTWWHSFLELTRRFAPAWSLASLLLIIVLLASNLMLWRQVRQLDAASRDMPMRVISLQETEYAPGASGLLVISMDGKHGTLVVDDLRDLGEDWQYQLWLIDAEGERTSGGVFSVKEDGYASLWVGSPRPLDSYPAFGVTIEPVGGSPAPTGEKVLGGEL